MGVPDESLLATVYRARGVETFVKLIVIGGLALLAGLWAVALAPVGSAGWAVGAAVAALGVASLARGISRQIEY